MPTTDLRALAGRLDLLQPCEVCAGRGWMARWHDGLDKFDSCTCPVCVAGQRLPTESEVRAAIFEADYGWLDMYVSPEYVNVEVGKPLGSDVAAASFGESDDLVLLALLRALEGCRG